MRVCLVSREVSPFYGAGIGTYVSSMARAWARAGHEVHVLTGRHGSLDVSQPGAWFAGVRFHKIDPLVGRAGSGQYKGFERYAMAAHEALAALHRSVNFGYIEFPDYWAEGAFALADCESYSGAVMGVRLHTPTDLCRELNQESTDDPEIRSLVEHEYGAIARADVLVSPSTSLLEKVRRRLGTSASVPGVTVPYPFFTDQLGELGLGPAHTSGPSADRAPTEILFIGRLERRKGVHLLIEAAQLLLEAGVDARFRFVGGDTTTAPGGGSMRAWLEGQLPGRWRDRFIFEPPVPRPLLGPMIQRAGVCCFPSIWENFPNVCLEAMAAGACVVGSDAGGMGEIIEDGRSGLLFPSGDAAGLAAVLGRAIGDGELRRAVASAAPGRVRQLCDPVRVAAVMEGVIKEARESRRPS